MENEKYVVPVIPGKFFYKIRSDYGPKYKKGMVMSYSPRASRGGLLFFPIPIYKLRQEEGKLRLAELLKMPSFLLAICNQKGEELEC